MTYKVELIHPVEAEEIMKNSTGGNGQNIPDEIKDNPKVKKEYKKRPFGTDHHHLSRKELNGKVSDYYIHYASRGTGIYGYQCPYGDLMKITKVEQ